MGACVSVMPKTNRRSNDDVALILDALSGWECHMDDADGPPCDAKHTLKCYLTPIIRVKRGDPYLFCACLCHGESLEEVRELFF